MTYLATISVDKAQGVIAHVQADGAFTLLLQMEKTASS
jgi:hypothetical protein